MYLLSSYDYTSTVQSRLNEQLMIIIVPFPCSVPYAMYRIPTVCMKNFRAKMTYFLRNFQTHIFLIK